MNLSFSTRGWNDLPWETQVRDAEEYRFQGIELYNLSRTPALTDRKGPFHPYHQNETLRNLKEKGLVISNLDTSIDLSDGEINEEEFRFLFTSAVSLRVPYVTVCALKDDEDQVRKNIETLLPMLEGTELRLLFKTTGIYADTSRLRALMDLYARDELGALWDMHHPFRDFGEIPDTTIRNLGAYVRHVHLRDSDDEGAYNLIGEGSVPLKDLMRALGSIDYSGFVSMEWKPEWMPDLPLREVIFPYFVNYMRRFDPKRGQRNTLYPNHDGSGQYVWKKDELIDLTFSQVLDRMVAEFPDQYAFRYTTLDYTRT